MSMENLGATMHLGATALTAAQSYAAGKSSKRMVLLDGLLADIDRTTETLDMAYQQLMSGQMVDYPALYNHVNNVIDLIRTGVNSLHAAAGLGIMPMPFMPFGPGGASSGMFTPGTPQGGASSNPAMMASMKARSLAPQVQAMRMKMREIKQIVSKLRMMELAPARDGLGGLSENPVLASMPAVQLAAAARGGQGGQWPPALPPQPMWLRALTLGLAVGGFYHGYNRNNRSFGWGFLWTLPAGLLGPLGGSIALAKAVSDGYAKPAAAPAPPSPAPKP